jgi:hypothetical protein
MEGGLFVKYQILFSQLEVEKENISSLVSEVVGITLDKKKIKIKEKIVTLSLSSGERMIFFLKGGEKILKESGYKVLLR